MSPPSESLETDGGDDDTDAACWRLSRDLERLSALMGWWGWPRLAALIADHCLWSLCLHNFHRGNNVTGTERRGPVPCRLPQAALCHQLWVETEGVKTCDRALTIHKSDTWELTRLYSVRHYYLKQASAKVHQGSAHISASRLVFSSHLSTKISKYPAGGIYLSPVLYLFFGSQL